jgi:hypothetical protein
MFKIDQTQPPKAFEDVGMKSGLLIETEALKVCCPTCGAGPKMKCELVIGGPRRQSHLDRRLIASDSLSAKTMRLKK